MMRSGNFPFSISRIWILLVCVRSSQSRILMNIKSILHITRRMMFGKIKCSEIVPVVFNFRSFCNGKSKTLKYFNDVIAHQADRMAAA